MNPSIYTERVVHVLLCEELGGETPPDVCQKVLARIQPDAHSFCTADDASTMHRARRTHWGRWVGIAASLAIGVGLMVATPWRKRPAPVPLQAQVEAGVEGARVYRNGVWTPTRDTMALHAGDRLDTGKRGGLKIAYADEDTWVEASANTRLGFLSASGGKRVQIDRGRIEAGVAPQDADRPMVVTTPNATVGILGTRFRVVVREFASETGNVPSAIPFSTRLDVLEGRVWLKRTADGASVEVPAGWTATAAPGIALKAIPLPSDLSDGSIRRIEDHEGPLAWRQSEYSEKLDFGLTADGRAGGRALRVVYAPGPDDKWTYGAIVHPFELQPGDQVLHFFMRVESYDDKANWNIQFRLRDRTCWSIGNGVFRDLVPGWNRIELDLPAHPRNAWGDGVYRPGEVRELIFSVCQYAAAFSIDDLAVGGNGNP